MGDVTQALKKRLAIGIVKRNEIIRLIDKGVNTSYSIGKILNLDPGTVKHHLDWLEEKGILKSNFVVEKGRAKKVFELNFSPEVLEKVMEILDVIEIDVRDAEKRIAELVLEVVEAIENDEMGLEEADRIFTALLALKNIELSEECEELITIGNELHDNASLIPVIKMLAKEMTLRP
jgi:predicted ArsR family transcriptional regulator